MSRFLRLAAVALVGACTPFAAADPDAPAGDGGAGPGAQADAGATTEGGGPGDAGCRPPAVLCDDFDDGVPPPRRPRWDDQFLQGGVALRLSNALSDTSTSLEASFTETPEEKRAYLQKRLGVRPSVPFTIGLAFRARAAAQGQFLGPRLLFCTDCGAASPKRVHIFAGMQGNDAFLTSFVEGITGCDNCLGASAAPIDVATWHAYRLQVAVTATQIVTKLFFDDNEVRSTATLAANQQEVHSVLVDGEVTARVGLSYTMNGSGSLFLDDVEVTVVEE